MKGITAGNGRMMRLGFVITICILHGKRNLNSIWFVGILSGINNHSLSPLSRLFIYLRAEKGGERGKGKAEVQVKRREETIMTCIPCTLVCLGINHEMVSCHVSSEHDLSS